MHSSDNKTTKTDKNSFKNTFIAVLSIVIGLGIGIYLKKIPKKNVVEEISSEKDWQDLAQFHELLLERWENGEKFKDKLSLGCLQSKLDKPYIFSDQYLRCNEDFFNCLIDKDLKYKVQFIERKKDVLWWSVIDLNNKKVGMQFQLKNNCHDVVVPQKIYDSVLGNKKMWSFDTFGQNIIADRYLSYTKNNPEVACRERGKFLFTAQLYDALTLFPLDPESKNAVRDYSLNPWSRKKRETFLYKLQMRNYKLTEKDCRTAYVKECSELLPYKLFASESTSLYGIGDVLGGPLEVFYNPLKLQQNLRLSSFYFEGKSEVHEIGKRGEWDRLLEQRQIGYRCFSYY
jgi:hypothetical protein